MATHLSGTSSSGNTGASNHPSVATPTSTPAATPATVGTTPQNPVQTADHGERYWLILQNNVEWVRFSDSKAGLILTTYGVLFTIIYSNAKDVFTAVKGSSVISWLVWVFGMSAFASICCAFWAVRPRLKAPGDSIIYFKHISENNVDAAAYKAKAQLILDDEISYTKHLTQQIWSLSEVATNKYNWTSYSIYSFFISVAALVLIVLIYVNKILSV